MLSRSLADQQAVRISDLWPLASVHPGTWPLDPGLANHSLNVRAILVLPGMGTGGTASGPKPLLGGVRSCVALSSASHSITWPVYAASRPMIALSVLSATCWPSF